MEKNRTSFPAKNPAAGSEANLPNVVREPRPRRQQRPSLESSLTSGSKQPPCPSWATARRTFSESGNPIRSFQKDIVLGNSGGSRPATPRANTANNASGVRLIHDGLGGHHGVMGSDPDSTDGHAFAVDKPELQKGKAQWSEHVWGIRSKDVVGRLSGILNLKADGWLRKPAKTSKEKIEAFHTCFQNLGVSTDSSKTWL